MLNVEIGDTDRRQGLGHFGAKFGEEVVDPCMPNFKAIWKMHGAIVCKRNHVDIFCRLSTMHARCTNVTDRQTDRQTMHGTVTSIAIGESACHRRRLIILQLCTVSETISNNIWLRGVMSQYHRVASMQHWFCPSYAIHGAAYAVYKYVCPLSRSGVLSKRARCGYRNIELACYSSFIIQFKSTAWQCSVQLISRP